MNDVLDMHMHTIVSGHAYSTLSEMVAAGKHKKLQLIGITEHAPALPGTCHDMYFRNFKVINRHPGNIELMMGAEVNIMDYDGNLDMREDTLQRLDYGIASFHEQCIKPGSKEENTAALLNAIKNPYIKIIGHPDNGAYPVDFDVIAKTASQNNVLLELNNSSYSPRSGRINSRENGRLMLSFCKKYNTSVILDSDAHIADDVGNHKYIYDLLAQIDFPEKLIVNTDVDKLKHIFSASREQSL